MVLANKAEACAAVVVNERFPAPTGWERVLTKLASQNVLSGALSAFDPHNFGYAGGGVMPAIPLGTLSMAQFGDGINEVRTVIPGLIYTQLILRWATWIGEDYGKNKGQLFALLLLNPDQRLVRDEDDAGVELGSEHFRSMPSLYDLAYLRKRALEVSHEQWEKICWTYVSGAFYQLRSSLKVEVPAFDQLHQRLSRAPGLRKIDAFEKETPRQSRYDFEYEVSGILVSPIGEETPFTSLLQSEVGLRESGARAKAPYVLMDLWGYGLRGEVFREHMAAYARYNAKDLGVALAIEHHTARRMLADIEALRVAVNEVFGEKK